MTELEMSIRLGILADPEKNRVKMDSDSEFDILIVAGAFSQITSQKKQLGALNPDVWLEFLPWHSLN